MTPERALVERVRPIVVQIIKDVQSSMRRLGGGIEVTYRDTAWCDAIAAFAAEYARERVDGLVEAINKEHSTRHGIQPAMGPCPYLTCVAVAKLVTS